MKEDLRVKSNKYFKPKYGERYWFVDTRGGIHWYHWRDDNLNNLLYLNNEVYRTEEEAEFARDENQFLLKMQRDFEDNSDVIDWSDSTQTKHTLDYTHNVGWLGMASDGTLQEGKLYTTNLDWLKQYIKDNEEDIIRYYFRITDGSSDNNSSGSRVSAEELIIPSEGVNYRWESQGRIKMKEIIKQIEDMGFEVEVSNVGTTVRRNEEAVAWVVTYQPYSIDTAYDGFYELDDTTKEKLFNLLLQLYQEPEYYWVIKGLGELDDEMAMLSELDGKYGIGMFSVSGESRTQFTKREFEEIKKELGFTLEFEPEEVD